MYNSLETFAPSGGCFSYDDDDGDDDDLIVEASKWFCCCGLQLKLIVILFNYN